MVFIVWKLFENQALLYAASRYVGSSHYTAPEVLQNYLSESPYPYHLVKVSDFYLFRTPKSISFFRVQTCGLWAVFFTGVMK